MSAGLDYLTTEDLLQIARGVIESDVGVRDAGLLASAAARPQASAFGEDAYPSFAEKAAALMHSIVAHPALVDGNKRLAWSATRVFCLLNGRVLQFSAESAETLIVSVARGELQVTDLAAEIDRHLRPA